MERKMLAQPEVRNHVIGRHHARDHGLHDHLTRTAEARRRRAEVIAEGVRWAWTQAWRALNGLMNGKPREQTPGAFRRARLRLARLVRRFIVEPHARTRRRRIAVAQLRSLDDRLLADIGLARGQIELAVDGMLARSGHTLSRPAGRFWPAAAGRELPLAA
jgi:uncharacterized protein YjiS (DUF1127 family)